MNPQEHRCMIVAAQDQATAQALCEGFAPVGGAGMFTTPRSATGSGAPSHYISSGMIDQDFALLMDAGADSVWQAVKALGIPGITEAQVQSMFARGDVSLEEPDAACTRLGLALLWLYDEKK